MNKEVYKIKNKVKYGPQESIPIIQPDHVSLGKCATCQEFKRRYSSIQDIEIINILRDGCKHLGFKKLIIESMEEEGFANMHHVIRIATLDESVVKEICIQRQTDINLKKDQIKETSAILTDTNSIVIVNYNKDNYFDLFFFSRHIFKKFSMDYIDENIFIVLREDKLYFIYGAYIKVINFSEDHVVTKMIEMNGGKYIAALSSEMLLYSVTKDGKSILFCDNLQESQEVAQVHVPYSSIFDDEFYLPLYILSYRNNIYWIILQDEQFSLYYLNKSNELNLVKTIVLSDLFGSAYTSFSFESCYYNRSTKQVFMMYHAEQQNETTRYILVYDMRSLSFACILEMELTLKRDPSFKMCPSRDGSKLFVQETFENKVMFYQVFTLMPTELLLENITAMYIRTNLSEEHIKSANLPRYLKEDLLGGD